MMLTGLSQWADSVLDVSSEYSGSSWAAERALGPPDVSDYGDYANAWAPAARNGTIEQITLGFDTPVYANGVTIRETWGNGFVTHVEVRNQSTGSYETVWSGTDPSLPGAPVDFLAAFPQRVYLVDAVRITSDTDHSLSTWEEIDAVALHGTDALDTTPPTVDLADPVDGGSIVQSVLNSRGYVDVTFADTGGSGLDAATITDTGMEFTLAGSAASGVTVDGAATLVSGNTYRYSFTGSFSSGPVTMNFASETFADMAGNSNAAVTRSFTVQLDAPAPSAFLADPAEDTAIAATVLNERGYLDVTFVDNSGSGLNASTITDSDLEFTLGGAAANGVTLNGAAALVSGTTYRYSFTGTFGTGPVTADFAAGSFADNVGKTNVAEVEGFIVDVGSQWASSVIDFSSQYSSTGWAAAQALGPPDVFAYGDYSNAWAPLPQNGTTEHITLGFDTPIYADGVTIRETYGNGFVTEMEVRNASTGVYESFWSGTDPSLPGNPVDFQVSFARRAYLVDAVRITVDTDHSMSEWEEIDAVALRGSIINDIAPPTADLHQPADGDSISAPVLNSRGYIDVTYADTGGSGLAPTTITDSAPEFTLDGAAASGVSLDGAAVLVSGTTYRYSFVGSFDVGVVSVNFPGGTFTDRAGNTNVAETQSFTVQTESTPPTASLADPLDGGSILETTLNDRHYIDVTFIDNSGIGLDLSTIKDAAPEFTFGGTAASGVTLNGAAALVSGTTYRYGFTGSFGTGEVNVEFPAGTFTDNAGIGNQTQSLRFTVETPNTPPVARDDEYAVRNNGVLLVLEGVPYTLLGNDDDPDGDDLVIDSVDKENLPDGPALIGTLGWTPGGAFLYDPRGEFDALEAPYPDRFRYTVSDGRGGADTATVTIWVTPDDVSIEPTANLADPVDGASIVQSVLNNRGYIDVTFVDNAGSGLDTSTITDSEREFTLEGEGASDVTLNGAAVLVSGTTYRYSFTGSFGDGEVIANFAAETFADNLGRVNAATSQSFTVQSETAPPTADLAAPPDGASILGTVLNERGYIDVIFVDHSGSGLNTATITDSEREFTLEGEAASDVTLNGAAVPVSGMTYRYTFTGSFDTGPVTVDFIADSFADNAGKTNLTESESFVVDVDSQWAGSVIDFSSQYSSSSWSAQQALGEPDVFAYGDYSNAWAPWSKNGTTERITLGFDTPAYAEGVIIRETYGNGFVREVEVRNASTGVYESVWSGTDPSLPGNPVDFQISFAPRTYLVDAVRITVDTDHSMSEWEEIDAVSMLGGIVSE